MTKSFKKELTIYFPLWKIDIKMSHLGWHFQKIIQLWKMVILINIFQSKYIGNIDNSTLNVHHNYSSVYQTVYNVKRFFFKVKNDFSLFSHI